MRSNGADLRRITTLPASPANDLALGADRFIEKGVDPDTIAAAIEEGVGDVDPLQAIEDALRMFPADEVIVLTAPDEEATWLEAGLGEKAQERFWFP